MAVAALSGAQPGERVLDLCAAPGGKTTQIAGRMRGEGLLIANEIHPARARILSQNVERMGIRNAIVTNESPEKLAARFPVFFDRILVDAPCSGEGMFRKEEQALLHWSEENVALCARRQQEILEAADRMLCDGGTLVYSTCTFAPEENEGSVWRFLLRHPEYTIQEAEGAGQRNFAQGNPGWLTKEERSDAGEVAGERPDGGGTPRHAAGVKPDAGEVQPGSSRSLSEQSAAQPHHPDELARTVRLWPHCVRGEGHFIAVLHKAGTAGRKLCADQLPRPDRAALSLWEEFCGQTLCGSAQERLARSGIPILFGEELYLMPEAVSLDKLRVLRPGLHLGTIRRKRFEPSHALALALREEDAVRVHAFSACGPEPDPGSGAVRFLKGETITCDPQGRGWTLVLADGYPLGWGKANSGILKNHYPKGLRWQ